MKRLVLLAAVLFPVGSLFAQAPQATPPQPDRIPVWRCELPGGTYTVALRAIVSVSIHEYIADGAVRVTEVNIDTSGNCMPRFYFQEPVMPQSPLGIGQSTINKVQEIVSEAAKRTGQEELWKKAVKNYPTTTHSHTIDYRVDSRETLTRIFDSADNAFRKLRDTTLRLKEE